MMPTHEASAQMLGYFYQVRYALFLLLDNGNTDAKICIEKFDDILFEKKGSPKELIQMKHHINKLGNLTDKSVDLWKTIKVWLDLLDERPELIDSCKFMIVTCSKAPKNSAASYLKRKNRDVKTAYSLLKKAADSAGNTRLEEAYKKFKDTKKNIIISLLENCEIIDNEKNIIDLEEQLLKYIRLSCYPGHEENVLNDVEGWWCKQVIKLLSSTEQHYIDFNSLRKKVVHTGRQYGPDILPIDNWDTSKISDMKFDKDKRIFVQQLRLIGASNEMYYRACKNYYRATEQRNVWIEKLLLLPGELDDYEDRLKDEWEEERAYLEDDDPQKSGKKLYEILMHKEINIRRLCTAPFVMRGSYQILSQDKKIGWHRDYKEKLEGSKRGK